MPAPYADSPLRPEDFRTSTWHRLQAYLEQRLTESRLTLESDLPLDETLRLRERIRTLKSLLALESTPTLEDTFAGDDDL